MDYYTAFANSLGIPAVTLPVQEGYGGSVFPSSVKIHALIGEDYHLLRIANAMEQMIASNGMSP